MIELSDRAADVVLQFAGNMGLHQIQPARDGSVSFAIEDVGILSFTPAQDGNRALISLQRTQPFLQNEDLKRFLALAHYDYFLGAPVSAGMARDGALVLAASLDDAALVLSTAEQCVDRLIDLHNAYEAQ